MNTNPPLPLTHAERQRKFGRFQFASSPTPLNPEHVAILNGWAEANIVQVWLPQLKRSVQCNAQARDALLALWDAWDRAELLGGEECPGAREGTELVVTWNGMWNPRFKRQPGTTGERALRCAGLGAASLSNHAWGTAFDVNAAWNRLGSAPAPRGAHGCVLDLVELAEAQGWFWGGRFRTRPDGMHFEWTGAKSVAASPRDTASQETPSPARTASSLEAATELLSNRPLSRERVRVLQAALGGVMVDGVRGPATKAQARRILAGG